MEYALPKRLLNVSLRVLSLLTRFVLGVFLAKVMLDHDFGFYGLFAASIGYMVYVVGMDFYTFTVRDLVGRPQSQWRALLRDQLLLYSAAYVCSAVMLLALATTGAIGWSTALWFLAILCTEHLSQELNRLLIIAGQVLASSVSLFIRSGLWVWLLVGMWALRAPQAMGLEWVFTGWLAGGLLSILFSLFWLRSIVADRSSTGQAVDWSRLRHGIKVAGVFFVGTLALKLVFTIDRYFVQHFEGLAGVGPYALFIGLATAISMLVDSAVVAYDYPQLIKSWQDGDKVSFDLLYASFLKRICAYALLFSAGLALGLPLLLTYIDKPSITAAWPVVVPMILANISLSLSFAPHYALYAARQDAKIRQATVFASAVFVLAGALGGTWWGALGVAWGLCLSMSLMGAIKWVFWRRVVSLD